MTDDDVDANALRIAGELRARRMSTYLDAVGSAVRAVHALDRALDELTTAAVNLHARGGLSAIAESKGARQRLRMIALMVDAIERQPLATEP